MILLAKLYHIYSRKGGTKLIRTILVTECINEKTGQEKRFYGRYDPVTLQRGNWKVVNSFSQKYSMTDEEFVKHAKVKEN